jgi:hypothetical protein
MISHAAVGKAAKSSGLLMLLVGMTVVPLFVYSAIPRASAWGGSESSTSAVTTTYSGRAFVASQGTMPPFGDTGDLPPSGGSKSGTVAPVTFLGIGSVNGLASTTMGFGNTAQSMASAGSLSLRIPVADSPTITASFLMAQSTATCTGVSGSSTVSSLSVNGVPVPVGTGTNQVVTIGFGAIIITINEQTMSTTGGTNSITVNALHITTSPPSALDIIIASAHSDITCASSCHAGEDDFVTGSGEERDSSDGQARQMGFDAGHENDMSTTSGHMTYVDNGAGVNMQSIEVTSYSIDALNQRTFGGHANYNGAPGYTYQMIVQDNAERGTGLDTFSIAVFDPSSLLVYTHSGTFSSGDIKMHNSGNECD